MTPKPDLQQKDLDRQRHLHENPSGVRVSPVWLGAYEKLVHEDSWGCSLGPPGYFCKDCWLEIDALYLQRHWEWHQEFRTKLDSSQNVRGWYPGE